MEDQPNEIITYILSYLDNRDLNLARGTCQRWKHLIESGFKTCPELHVCLLNRDYYHFGKNYLNYVYGDDTLYAPDLIHENDYYANLTRLIGDKYFMKQIPQKINIILENTNLLIYAAYKTHLEVVKYMVNIGTNISDYALFWSAVQGHLNVVKYLVEKGVNLHANKDEAVRVSATYGYLEVVKYLVEKGADIHAKHDEAFRYSAERGHLETIKYLIEHNADIHADDDYALRKSVKKCHLNVVIYLISQGADLNAHYEEIMIYGPPSIVEYLQMIM